MAACHPVPNLRVRLDDPALKRNELDIAAWIDPANELFLLRDRTAAGRVAAGGYAVASLFRVESRRIAQAWMAAWADAEDGHRADAVTLASRRAADERTQRDANRARLTRLQSPKTSLPGSRPQKSPKATTTGPSQPMGPQSTRTLVDPASLVLSDPGGQLVAGGIETVPGSSGRGTRPLRAADLDRPRTPPATPRGPTNYTDTEREDVGMDLLKQILAGSGTTLTDIRHQHNVGADAIDDRGRYYELKVHEGLVPDQVRLTNAEIQRALSTDEYYLVIVSNVEAGRADPEVRIVTDPLSQLTVEPSGFLLFSGVRAAQTLTYTFVASAVDDETA